MLAGGGSTGAVMRKHFIVVGVVAIGVSVGACSQAPHPEVR